MATDVRLLFLDRRHHVDPMPDLQIHFDLPVIRKLIVAEFFQTEFQIRRVLRLVERNGHSIAVRFMCTGAEQKEFSFAIENLKRIQAEFESQWPSRFRTHFQLVQAFEIVIRDTIVSGRIQRRSQTIEQRLSIWKLSTFISNSSTEHLIYLWVSLQIGEKIQRWGGRTTINVASPRRVLRLTEWTRDRIDLYTVLIGEKIATMLSLFFSDSSRLVPSVFWN